jgi:hypothetical protein
MGSFYPEEQPTRRYTRRVGSGTVGLLMSVGGPVRFVRAILPRCFAFASIPPFLLKYWNGRTTYRDRVLPSFWLPVLLLFSSVDFGTF